MNKVTHLPRSVHTLGFFALIFSSATIALAQAEPPTSTTQQDEAAVTTQSNAASEASRLAAEAAEAYAAGQLEVAIDKYERAFRLVPDPSFAYNLAGIHHELGNVVETTNYFNLYLRLFPGAPDRAEVEAVLAELLPTTEATYALLDATALPTGTQVYQLVNGEEVFLGTAPFEWWTLPGELTFIFRLNGYDEARTTSRSVPGLRVTPLVELNRTVVVQETPIQEIAQAHVAAAVVAADSRARTSAIATQTAIDALGVTGCELAIPAVSPEGANVWLDGEWIGQAPGSFEGLEPGQHQLELRAEGYHTHTQTVTLEEGVSIGVADVTLEPYMIRMLVRSNSNNTWLYANGERFGVLPDHDQADVFETRWGADYVMAYARHRRPYRIDLIGVEPGEDLNITIDMKRHWNERALRTWTSIAAIGGAVAVGVAMNDDLDTSNHDTAVANIQAAAGGAAVITMGMIVWGILDHHEYYPEE